MRRRRNPYFTEDPQYIKLLIALGITYILLQLAMFV